MPAWPPSRTRSANPIRHLAETKDRLIALQMEHRAADARAKPLEAELAQAKRAAEQAIEQEMRQRQRATLSCRTSWRRSSASTRCGKAAKRRAASRHARLADQSRRRRRTISP